MDVWIDDGWLVFWQRNGSLAGPKATVAAQRKFGSANLCSWMDGWFYTRFTDIEHHYDCAS